MDKEFITIHEASRLLNKPDTAVMLLIKEALQEGVAKEEIMKTEMQEGRMMYLVSKEFLLEKPEHKEQSQDKEEALQEQPKPGLQQEKQQSSDLLAAKDEMIATLQKIVNTKDQQLEDLSGKIDQLIERDHETNILLKGLQDRLFLLEGKKKKA